MNSKLFELFNVLDTELNNQKAKKKKKIVKRNYSFCKSMLYAIQNITGEKTHDILATLVAKADETLKNNNIDPETVQTNGWYDERRARTYIYYPNTKLYLGVYIGVRSEEGNEVDDDPYSKRIKFNRVNYTFKLPQTFVKMNDKEYDNLSADAILTDFSEDLDAPKMKVPLTPEEKAKKEEEKRAIAQMKRDAKKAKKLKGP